MKFVIAPDSFKNSLPAVKVAQSIQKGILAVLDTAQTVMIPMADGGEGTVATLIAATDGQLKATQVKDPLNREITAHYGLLGDQTTAVIEMAAASGIELLTTSELNPLVTTTYGTGELIKAALDDGVTKIIIGIGGSATNDGGAGMLQALGGRLLDANGHDLSFGGSQLKNLTQIDLSGLDPRLANVDVLIASDVNNPLTGPKGASEMFGPQKGATPAMVAELEASLTHYAHVITEQLGKDIVNIPGAGAAGGLGAGLMAFTSATMRSGIQIVMEYSHLAKELQNADVVFTGEGRLDGQTQLGKVPLGVAQLVKQVNPQIKVIALGGSVSDDAEQLTNSGIDALFSIMNQPTTLKKAIVATASNIEQTVKNVVRLLK